MKEASRIAELYQRHAQHVYRLCYSFMHSTAEAEDATQATFIRLCDHPQVFVDEKHERAWLLKVAANICRDILKSAAYSRVVQLPEGQDFVDNSATADQIDSLQELVFSLPDKYKDVVYMHYYEDMPTKDIAEALELPASTVRNHLSEARALLAELLAKES